MSGYGCWLGLKVAGGLALLTVGCTSEVAHPLYTSDRPLTRAEVAQLSGYVHHVDGQDVSSIGGTYELLPGCHVVDTPTKWGQVGQTGGVVVTTGRLSFALPMKAGQGYSISVESTDTGGPTGTARVLAKEMDANGAFVRNLPPAANQAELDACARLANESRPR